MTTYLDIRPMQPPFDLGVDELNRAIVGFNIIVEKHPSTTFLEEIVAVLVAAGVGTFNTNIFASSSAAIPSGNGPYLTVVHNGGAEGRRTHNSAVPAYQKPTAKISARASTYASARTMAEAAYGALAVVRNSAVNP